MSVQLDMRTLLRELPRHELARLLRELLAHGNLSTRTGDRRPYGAELARAERWLGRSAELACSPRQRNSRMRMWLVFMLLRYGGLRLEEVFALRLADLDLGAGFVSAGLQGHQRHVPLPPTVARRLRHGLENWPAALALDSPFRCDSSQVRRALAQCAQACGLKPEMLNARALRRHRALELEFAGLSADLVNLFMGRNVEVSDFNYANARNILRQAIQNEQTVKTSARNAFYGQLIHLERKGILVEALLETAGGLKVAATITETSRQSLRLEQGLMATALVKAPWVKICTTETGPGTPNVFDGTLEEIKSDGSAAEVLVSLPQGNLVCALYVDTPVPDVVAGAPVKVNFSPFSVILTTG